MKKILTLAVLSAFITFNTAEAQGARKSPKATATETISSGATVTIEYSQPSLNGRTVGKDVEPKAEAVWRMGANEATTFEVDKDVTIDGNKLPAGKYSMFGISHDNTFTIILNSAWKIWGTQYDGNADKNVLKFEVKKIKTDTVTETLTYKIDKDGKVSLMWGDLQVAFWVK
jgi:hypothetical protein